MNDEPVIGIDLGTSGVKAVLRAADGTLVAETNAPLDVQRPPKQVGTVVPPA